MYIEIQGDLIEMHLQGKFDYIAHGANCQKIMGGGIAAQIARKIPTAYTVDKEDKRVSIQRLGDFTIDEIGKVVNLYTQYQPGRNLDYDALTLCLRKLNMLFRGCNVGLPFIGCGIAGGDWNKVKEIIKKELKNINVTVVNYE